MDLVDRFFAAHHEDVPIDDLFAPDHKAKVNGVVTESPEAACQTVKAWREAFNDGRFEIMGRLVQGDDVAVTWIFHGVHAGPFLDQAPSEAAVSVEGATRFTLKDGRIHRLASRWDHEGLLRQFKGTAE